MSDFKVELSDLVSGFQSGPDVVPSFEALNWGGVGNVATGAFQRICELLAEVLLANVTEDEFVKLVLEKYDLFIAPALVALGPWGAMANPFVRALVKQMAIRFYRNNKPA